MPHTDATAAPTARTPRRAALWMTPDEADAFLSVLMAARPSETVSARVAEQLLCRVASVRRTLLSGRRDARPKRRLARTRR